MSQRNEVDDETISLLLDTKFSGYKIRNRKETIFLVAIGDKCLLVDEKNKTIDVYPASTNDAVTLRMVSDKIWDKEMDKLMGGQELLENQSG